MLCIDLDGFKAVNDLHGHPAGDELLIEAAHRLRTVVRGNELVARLGGDEFAVVQEGGSQPTRAGLLSERIIEALRQPFAIGGQNVRISASIGVAVYPADADTPTDLIKNADMALYRAKAEGRGFTRFYEAAMDEALRQRRQLEADLCLAIGRRGAESPLSAARRARAAARSPASRRCCAGIIRGSGRVGPEMFIRLAEESGLIVKLGDWVLREACAEAARWTPPLKLAVNLSPLQFMQEDLVDAVERVLAETGLAPAPARARSDRGAVDQGRRQRDRHARKAEGARRPASRWTISAPAIPRSPISGMFPFDKVKIDQGFVRDMIDNPQALAIIRSVIGLGHGLGVPVVAEGVETQAQLDALRAEGCDQVQGFFIARPNPIGYFEGVVMDRGAAEPEAIALPRRRA